MKDIKINKTKVFASLIAFLLVNTIDVSAGTAPTTTPSSDQVIGIGGDSLDIYASGGSSDEPDQDPSCGDWTLEEGSEDWLWKVSDPSTASMDSDCVTITPPNSVKVITVSVARNDTYEDGNGMEADGVPSDDSDSVNVHVVKVEDTDPSQKWYYFGHPGDPYPKDVEQHRFNINGDNPPDGSNYDWYIDATSPTNAHLEDDPDDPENSEIALSTASGGVKINAYWGSQNLGSVTSKVRTKGKFETRLARPEYTYTIYGQGWTQDAVYPAWDNYGAAISDSIGINETFGAPNNITPNTWSSTPNIKQNNDVTTGGGWGDTYSIFISDLGNNVGTAYPETDEHSNVQVYTKQQTYRIGSLISGDGLQWFTQTIVFHLNGVTLENPNPKPSNS